MNAGNADTRRPVYAYRRTLGVLARSPLKGTPAGKGRCRPTAREGLQLVPPLAPSVVGRTATKKRPRIAWQGRKRSDPCQAKKSGRKVAVKRPDHGAGRGASGAFPLLLLREEGAGSIFPGSPGVLLSALNDTRLRSAPGRR